MSLFKSFTLIPLVLLISACPKVNQPEPIQISCLVTAVTDGDTIKCTDTNKSTHVIRLSQIDAPEKKQSFGTASKNALSSLIYNKHVVIKVTGQDQYGRNIGEIFFENNNINKIMVSNGFAWAYKEFVTDPEYNALESDAKNQRLGLWIEPNPLYPSIFRKQFKN